MVSNKTMNCGQAKRLLPPFLDEELSGRLRDGVGAHLASCPACRTELEALKTDMAFLLSTAEPEPPTFLVTRVMAEARQASRAMRRGFLLGRVLGAVTAILLIAVSISAGVFFGSGLARNHNSANTIDNPVVSYLESSTADLYALVSGGGQ
jgi:anti-sigma factor RsiW